MTVAVTLHGLGGSSTGSGCALATRKVRGCV